MIIETPDKIRHDFETLGEACNWLVEEQPAKCWLVDGTVRVLVEFDEPWNDTTAETMILAALDEIKGRFEVMREDADEARRDAARADRDR